MQLLLIRHAQTHSNVSRALDTAHPGADLTELGERQVSDLAAALAEEHIDRVFASPRLRTRRTAAGLADPRGIEPTLRDGLVEIGAGDHEMSTLPEHAEAYVETALSWVRGDLGSRLPGAESGFEALARFDRVISEVLATGAESVAVISHGAMLRTWCGARVRNVSLDHVRQHPLRNTGLIRLDGGPEGWIVTDWDEHVVAEAGQSGPAADPLR
ncbi:histidine phosphatase family protein [Nocardioides sp.]|uniref:histidine phosphatase family protein n=1 Tax=Nocardioides sp. TaxID=35761 RepID=UPI003D0B1F51